MSSGSDRYFLDLPRSVCERLAAHAADCLPEECCGILIGTRASGGRARVHYALETENAKRARRDQEFSIAPLSVLEAQRAARAEGLEILGYYHSHPSGSAAPSPLDRRNAWPETSYVILGMKDGRVLGLKSWRLVSGASEFVEETVRCKSVGE